MLVNSIAKPGDLIVLIANSPGSRVWTSTVGVVVSGRISDVAHPTGSAEGKNSGETQYLGGKARESKAQGSKGENAAQSDG